MKMLKKLLNLFKKKETVIRITSSPTVSGVSVPVSVAPVVEAPVVPVIPVVEAKPSPKKSPSPKPKSPSHRSGPRKKKPLQKV